MLCLPAKEVAMQKTGSGRGEESRHDKQLTFPESGSGLKQGHELLTIEWKKRWGVALPTLAVGGVTPVCTLIA